MNPVLWGGVVVVLLIVIAVITMSKTRWGRPQPDERPAGAPRDQGRVSGNEDD